MSRLEKTAIKPTQVPPGTRKSVLERLNNIAKKFEDLVEVALLRPQELTRFAESTTVTHTADTIVLEFTFNGSNSEGIPEGDGNEYYLQNLIHKDFIDAGWHDANVDIHSDVGTFSRYISNFNLTLRYPPGEPA